MALASFFAIGFACKAKATALQGLVFLFFALAYDRACLFSSSSALIHPYSS
jgi:hypothetical protein